MTFSFPPEGINTPITAHDQYTRLKPIWIDLSDPSDSEMA